MDADLLRAYRRTDCVVKDAETPRRANEAAMMRLERELGGMGLRWLRGRGVDPAGEWPGEDSVNAIICAGDDAVPRLVLASEGSE